MEKSIKNYFADLNIMLYNLLNFHWNVTGGLFKTLHELYQEYYEFIFRNIDQLAEILKSNNIYPLTTLSEINELSSLKTLESRDYTARETLETVKKQFEYLIEEAKSLVSLADQKGYLTLSDFFGQQITFFSKQLYFLHQFLK